MKKTLLTLALAVGSVVPAMSQHVAVSPTPRQIERGAKAFDRPTGLKITGEKEADVASVAALRKAFPGKKGINLTIGERGDKAVAKYVSKIPVQPEGYYLKVSPEGVVIAGNDETGTFYGVQTFMQLASVPEVMAVEISDSPMTAVRGVIEGFYGNPWSFDDRVSQFDFYGKNKMNIYIYGPKDDPYHHSRWFEPYPDDEVIKMKELIRHATDNKVKFVWAMHPSNSITSAEDKQKALDKFAQMYDLGVRSFAIFFDDISAKSVDDQIAYLNFLTDEFVNKHDDVEELIVCPTQYNKAWSGGDYLPKMGKGLYPGIRIMWTGNSVIDMIDKEDCTWFEGQTGRAPFIWLNYPVNDYGLHHLLMGPATGNGADIYDSVSAFCSNPMQYAEASKVALYGLADYAWNPTDYNAEEAWKRSMAVLAPGHEEAFGFFCINNVDIGESTHRLRIDGESPEFKAILDRNSNGEETSSAFNAYFKRMQESAGELLADTATSPLINEIKEFIEYFGLQGERGQAMMAMQAALKNKNANGFIEAFKVYDNLTKQAEELMSRGFEGSIQSVAPRTAATFVEPYIKNSVADMINEYKAAGYEYPEGLFPTQIVENGVYYITVNGKYLGNPIGEESAQEPVLQADRDVINPGRQLWIVRRDPMTDRYKIVNEWDKRYLTNNAKFATEEATFDNDRYTYQIFKNGDKYAIQNDGLGGKGYWNVEDGHIFIDKARRLLGSDDFIFELVKVN